MAALAFPFICLPDAAIWKPGLSARAKCLFNALIACRNRRTGLCNPRLATLADRLETSLSSIKRALSELRRAGMVIIHRTLWGNRYDIATPDQWGHDVTTVAFSSPVSPPDGSPVVPRMAHPRALESAPSLLYEPDVIEPEENPAAAQYVSTPVEAAAAASASCQAEPERPPSETARLVAELMPQHPEPGNLPKAVAEAEKLVASRPEAIPQMIEAIRRNHEIWRARWATYAPGRFIPQLWRWFHDGDWEHPPADRKGVRSETWEERRERERREHDEQFYRELAEEGAWHVIRQYGGEHAVEVWREKIKETA